MKLAFARAPRRGSGPRSGARPVLVAALALGGAALVAAGGGARMVAASGAAASGAAASVAGCSGSLQALLDAAAPGSTVEVPVCAYHEAVTIRRSITLHGNGATLTGRDPGGAVTRDTWLDIAASNVTVEHLTFVDADNPPQTGAIRVEPGVSNFTLRDSDLSGARGAAVAFGEADNSLVEGNRIHDNGQLGIHMGGDDIHGRNNTVRGNVITGNNKAGVNDPEWEAGGLKATRQVGLVITGNEVAGNTGPGLWCDIACRNVTITDNKVHDNTYAGIMFEVSTGALIDRNAVWRNGWSKAVWGWGAGILISSSGGAVVTNNTLAWNFAGISVISQDRTDWPHSATHDRVDGNVIAAETGRYLLFWGQDWEGELFRPESGNSGTGNRFWSAPEDGSPRFAWDGDWSSADAFATTPGGREGAYLTQAQRDDLLAAAGVPVDAGPHTVRIPVPLDRIAWPLLGAIAAAIVFLGAIVSIVLVILARRRQLARERQSDALWARVHGDEPPPPHRRWEGLARIRRIGWGIADQVLSSGTNFALSILMAHTLSVADFGAFTLAFAVYLFVISVARAYPMDPLAIRYVHATRERWRAGTAAATGTALTAAVVVAVLLGLVIASTGGLVTGVLATALGALAIVLPGLALQDAWRMAFFAAGRGRDAFLNDLTWALALVPALLFAAEHDATVGGFTLAWGAAAGVAALAGLAQARVVPNPLRIRAWWREHHDLAPRFLAESSIRTASGQLVFYGVGLAAGLAAVGVIRQAQLVLAPVQVAFMGINMTLVPEAVRALRRSSAYLWRFATLVSTVLVAVAVAWAALIVLADPLAGNLLVGADHWADARNLLAPILVFTMATVALSGPQMILRALANARLSLRAGVVSSLAGLAAPIALAFAGTTPAAWGLALGAITGLAAWWAAARIGIRAHDPGDQLDDGLPPGFGGVSL